MKAIKIKQIYFILLVLALVLITTVTTYSIFRFMKIGAVENSIQVGSITFHYKEISGKGQGINISNAYPISDTDGKAQNNYFDFRITSNSAFAEIPYVITAYAEGDVELANVVKVYLTEINNNTESQLLLSKYTDLTSITFTGKEEKVLYRTIVPVDGNSYEKSYRLRMWVDSEANFQGTNVTKYYCGDIEVVQGTICDNGKAAVSKHIQGSTYNNKSFSLRVNVYTNEGRNLTQDNVTTPDDTRLKMVTANNTYLFNNSTDEGVDLEVNVPNNVDSININSILTNMKATDTVTSLGQTLSYVDVPIVTRLSLSDTYSILTGDNYFKLRVRSADESKTKDYILKVTREKEHDNTLTYLEVEGYAFNEEFDSNRTSYTVSVEEESITITGNKSSQTASISGLGEKTLSWGINNYTITVTAEDGVPKEYHIEVNNVKPTAPTITGGTNGIESSLDQTISILSPGTAVSGVAYYEYYKSNNSTAPTDSTTGTQLTSPYELTVSDNGTSYIWYRTVSTKGNKSVWSNVQEVNINKAFEVPISGSNVTFSANTVNVEYGSTASVTITPASGYYISDGSCTNDYTITGLSIGTRATGSQTITINNNNQNTGSTCTFTAVQPVVPWQPSYFAFGTPTTSNTNPPTGKKVFAAMDTNGNKGVCIILENGERHCFKSNNSVIEAQHLREAFEYYHCYKQTNYISCNHYYDDIDYNCRVDTSDIYDGNVSCFYQDDSTETFQRCDVYASGNIICDDVY